MNLSEMKSNLYRKTNRLWLKVNCRMGKHRWVTDHFGRFRTCKHTWCAAYQVNERGEWKYKAVERV